MFVIAIVFFEAQPDHDPNTKHCLNGADGKIELSFLLINCVLNRHLQ